MTDQSAYQHRAFGPYSAKPKYVIVEKHLVVEGKQEEVVDYYKRMVMPVLDEIDGYLGMSVMTVEPDAGVEKDAQEIMMIGPPSEVLQPHASLRPNAGERTNLSIHMDAVLAGTYNLIFEHYLADDRAFVMLHDDLENIWQEKYGTDVWDVLADEYFIHFRNHWDTVYRLVDFA
jgi:hypothetical protein